MKQKNININAQDDFGETALMAACNISPEIIPYFFDHIELDFGIKNNKKETAWDIAKKLDNNSYSLLQKHFVKRQKEKIESNTGKHITFKRKPHL